MHFSSIIVQGILATGVTAARIKKVRRDIVPKGPTDPGITSKCTYYDTWFEDGIDCDLWLSDWNITPAQFTQYNLTVGKNCSGIKEGHSYCVEVNHGQPEEPEVTSTKASEPKPTKEPKPSPTQDGLIKSCTSFYQAKKGDTCPKIIANYGTFDFDTFFKWNPAIKDDCSGIWANNWYCVGVPGAPTAAPTKVAGTSTTPKPTGPSKPSTTQDGLIDSCVSFHQAGKGETCAKIVSNFGTFDFDTFFEWNPAVGKDCSGIWAGYYYCEDLAKNCNKFHQITSTTTCTSIERYYNLPLSQFIAWNPSVEKDCSGLWVGYWVCVSVEGYKPTTTTAAKPTTTKPANSISTPSPIQDSMVKNCEKFHQIKPTTTCTSIEDYYNLPFDTFYSWNPAVCVGTVGWKPPTKTTTKAATPTKPSNGINTPPPIQQNMVANCNKFHMVTKTTTFGSNCAGLWAGYNVCVGVVGGTPTQPGNGVKTPSPIQPKMVSNCKKFHKVTSTTTCVSIQKYYKIAMAQLVKWNPTVGKGCDKLWADYWVCVGV
ncbi:hypothetical protein BFJ69_g15358 [Fusarium oxysporum]|uniref:LysM domain-containing protein n=1 Tax=Fusarium oxysporum TaxID=5507 RepID=A0A420MFB5_FUSOX|nr:hypothetical protein BFJ69_g15358 [Fusarium oxysporum]